MVFVLTLLSIRVTTHRTLLSMRAPLASTVVMDMVGPNRVLETELKTMAMVVHMTFANRVTNVTPTLHIVELSE